MKGLVYPGRTISKRAPPWGGFDAVTVPPWRMTMACTMDRPRPLPDGSAVPVRAGQRWSSDAPSQLAAVVAAPPPAKPAVAPEPEPEPEIAPPAPRHASKPARPAPATVRTEPKLGSAHAEVADGDRDPDRSEYDRLAALEPRSPEAALAGYLVLARGTGHWADLALFAAARLAHDRHDRRARTLLDIYLQRFPDGANAADARKLLARLPSDPP